MFKLRSPNDRGAWCILAGLLLLSFAASAAEDGLQAEMGAVLKSDPRNGGVVVHVHRAAGDVLIYDLISVAPTNSMADVLRVLLQFANVEKAREFKNVQLSFRGSPRFLISGGYFQQLGQQFGTQNPVYTIRTLPENLTNLDGSRAYPSWSGGLIGVVGKQMEDANNFHRRWWMNEFAAAAQPVSGEAFVAKMPPSAASSSRDGSLSPLLTQQYSRSDETPAPSQQDPRTTKSSAPGMDQPLQIPAWLGFPENGLDENTAFPNRVHASYETPASFVAETGRFETELHKAANSGVTYDENGNGHSVTFRVAQARVSCSLQVRENAARIHVGARTSVEVDCTLSPQGQAGSPVSTTSAGQVPLPVGAHRIEYKIDGSAKSVGVTYRNPTGGTEQRDVVLPAAMNFYAMNGSFVYLSAQNKGDVGEVHVAVSVDGRILQEATSSTAYGIATASGSVPR